jgi:hypothetical protein
VVLCVVVIVWEFAGFALDDTKGNFTSGRRTVKPPTDA